MACYGYGIERPSNSYNVNITRDQQADYYNMGTAKIACYCSEHNKRSVKLCDKLPGNDSTLATNKIKFPIF